MEGKRRTLGICLMPRRNQKSGEGPTVRPRTPKENAIHSHTFPQSQLCPQKSGRSMHLYPCSSVTCERVRSPPCHVQPDTQDCRTFSWSSLRHTMDPDRPAFTRQISNPDHDLPHLLFATYPVSTQTMSLCIINQCPSDQAYEGLFELFPTNMHSTCSA